MTCTKPIEIDGALSFPCGKCMHCRIQRTQEWTIRIMHESLYWDKIVFITLTYDDENVPVNGSLEPEEFTLWMKRFRKDLGRKIKIFGNGEYGDKNGRPHYHVIVFGASVDDFEQHHSLPGKFQHRSWLYGFLDVKAFEEFRARYVAGYITKKLYGEMADEVYGGAHPPFQRSSHGLGKMWAIDHKDSIQENQCIFFKGVRMNVPRYYCKILGLDLSQFNDEKQEEKYRQFLDRYNKQAKKGEDLFDFNLQSKRQKDRNIQAKMDITNRNF